MARCEKEQGGIELSKRLNAGRAARAEQGGIELSAMTALNAKEKNV